jgi:hypothetical protein
MINPVVTYYSTFIETVIRKDFISVLFDS